MANLELRPDVRDQREVDAAVLDAEQLVHHRLVRPLGQYWRDWVAPPVQDEQQWRDLRQAEVE